MILNEKSRIFIVHTSHLWIIQTLLEHLEHVQLVGVVEPASPWKHVPRQHGYITSPVAKATRSEDAFSRVTRFVVPPTFSPTLPLYTNKSL